MQQFDFEELIKNTSVDMRTMALSHRPIPRLSITRYKMILMSL